MISGYVSSFSSIVTGGIVTIFQYSGYWWFGNLEITKRYYISVRYSLSPRTFVLAAAFVLRWVGRYLTLCLKISTYCIAHLIAPVIPPNKVSHIKSCFCGYGGGGYCTPWQGWLKWGNAGTAFRAEQGPCEPSKGLVSKFGEQ